MFHLLGIYKLPGHCLNWNHPPKRLQGQNANLLPNFVHGKNPLNHKPRPNFSRTSDFFFIFFKMASFVYFFWRRACLSTTKLKSWVWLSALSLTGPAEFSVFSKSKQKGVSGQSFALGLRLCVKTQNFESEDIFFWNTEWLQFNEHFFFTTNWQNFHASIKKFSCVQCKGRTAQFQ